jgi:Inner membrane protein YgaP-like, transmembrane domain
MGSFVGFMQSAAGRVLRVVAGLVLIGVGWFVVGGAWGVVIAIVGLVPLLAGAVGICLLAPLLGYTLKGERRMRHAS